MLTLPNSLFGVILSKNWLLLIISILCVAGIFAATDFSSPIRPSHNVVQGITHLVDTKKQYTISNVLSTTDNIWQQPSQNLTSLVLSDELYWFRFTISHVHPAGSRFLEIHHTLLDSVNIWFIQGNKILAEYQASDALAFSQRSIKHENFILPVPTSERSIEVYINTYSKGPVNLPLHIWTQNEYLEFISKSGLIMGVFIGLMLAMGLSSLFFFITTHSQIFLIYAGYVIFSALTLIALQGVGYDYIWPNSSWLQQYAVGIFANLAVCLSILFCERLLNVRAFNIKLSILLKITAYIFLLVLIISLFIPLPIFIKVFLLMLCGSGMLVLAVTIGLWVKGLTIAGYYTLPWAVLLVSGFTLSLDTLNIINVNLPSYYLLMLGVIIETLLLGLILAFSHNQQQTSLTRQAALLHKKHQAQHPQKDMWALQEDDTKRLEYKVQERTLELEVALRELSDTNRELQEKNSIDALTGLHNRSFFDKKYQAEVRRSRREQTQLSIVMVDIDYFKNVNDQYGHLVGDECIKRVAHTLKKALKRPSDYVSRFGGEEFTLILPNTDLEGALFLTEQLRAEIKKTTIQAGKISVNITISAGIGCAIADLNQPDNYILALADKQLYAAKNAGRNNVQGRHLDFTQQQDSS
jgi:diguanylate cyclase (GGDEF)-like protein